jgi:hypothetical protein
MSETLIIGLLVSIAFFCAFVFAERAASRLARSLREEREKRLEGELADWQHYGEQDQDDF